MKTRAAIYFLHGWGFNASIWSTFINQHFRGEDTVALEMPSYGLAASQSRTIESVCQDLQKQMIGGSVLVGWSLGGQVAMQFAYHFPEKVSVLVLLACSPCFVKKPDWPNGVDPLLVKELSKSLSENKDKALSRFYTQISLGMDKKKLCQFSTTKMKRDLELNALQKGLNLLLNEDQRAVFEKLRCPVHLCIGSKDPLVDSVLLEGCKKLNPQVHTYEMEKGGHAPFIFNDKETALWIKHALNGSAI